MLSIKPAETDSALALARELFLEIDLHLRGRPIPVVSSRPGFFDHGALPSAPDGLQHHGCAR